MVSIPFSRGHSHSLLYADLRGLPLLLRYADGAETLLDEVGGFANAATAAGVEGTCGVYVKNV